MRRRVALVTEIISPYRIPLFNALAGQPDIDLHVIFLAETDPSLRQWQIYKEEITFSYRVLSSWRRRIGKYNLLLNRGVTDALRETAPHVIICGGYSYIASWQCLYWSRSHRVPFLLWSESNQQDLRRGTRIVESLKKGFLSHCTGFIVPGQSAREYLRSQVLKDDTIFTAPNAVDNDLFSATADQARNDAVQLREKLALPDRYFLFVGRLVAEKGVFDLLAAYAKLEDRLRKQIGLVFVGGGACREALEEQAGTILPGVVRFAGFVQRNELANYYALAQALVLPTLSEPWGLVVNEAMACGLPIIVSEVAGCALDLVKPNWNGLLVSPGDTASLSAAMASFAVDPNVCQKMGFKSQYHISHFTPEVWAKSIACAIEVVGSVQ